jgi:glutamate-ammonia-ligase adenylyltransferase
MEHISQTAYDLPLPKGWKKEIVSMRDRMARERSKSFEGEDLKVGRGGLVDLEFLVQAAQLRSGREFPQLRIANTSEAIETIREQKLVNASEAKKIAANLEYFRRLEAFIRMNAEVKDFVLPAEHDRFQALVAAMGSSSPAALRRRIQEMRKTNRTLFNATIKSLPR